MEISSAFVVFVPIVIGLVEVLKRVVGINTRLVPLVALLFGAGLALGSGGLSFESLLQGVVVGLTAAGLYSSAKTTLAQ